MEALHYKLSSRRLPGQQWVDSSPRRKVRAPIEDAGTPQSPRALQKLNVFMYSNTRERVVGTPGKRPAKAQRVSTITDDLKNDAGVSVEEDPRSEEKKKPSWELLPSGARLRVWWEGCEEYYECTLLDWRVSYNDNRELVYTHRCNYEGGILEHDLSTLECARTHLCSKRALAHPMHHAAC